MAGERRRLAAILAADVVGYSRLMGADESGTLARLRALQRDVIEPGISRHTGRLFKNAGDGFLVEFASAVQAVTAAMEIQKAAAAGPLQLRIGIHVGDVIVDGDDLMGDGVNIAARIEGIAEAGGIALSRQVHDQVRDRLDVSFADKGEVELKNIARPVHVFAVGGAEAAVSAPALALPDKPSIAVLPFQNMSGDPEQEYFTDGVVEDIITELSRFRELFVISRNSTFTYKGRSVDVRQVARELGVRYVIEGSSRKAGSRVRVTAQLIDCETGSHLWAERYDRELSDIFAVQEEITRAIVSSIAPTIEEAGWARVRRRAPTNLTAYELAARAWSEATAAYQTGDPAMRGNAVSSAERALEIDPTCVSAWLALAITSWQTEFYSQRESTPESCRKGLDAAERAIELDRRENRAYLARGLLYLRLGRGDEALSDLRHACELNPNDTLALNGLAYGEVTYGDGQSAKRHLLQFLRLSPRDPQRYNACSVLGNACFLNEEYEEGLKWVAESRRDRPNFQPRLIIEMKLLAALGQLGRARALAESIRRAAPEVEARIRAGRSVYQRQQDRERDLKYLRMAFDLPSETAPALTLPDKPSIAVLPFQNMSGAPEQEYFADGIAEDIITNLSKVREFHVISRNSTFTYKGEALDVSRIGRELRTDYIVEGSVRSAGTRVRITAQLTKVSSAAHVWAERYDRELTDVFAVQDEITARIANAIDPAIRRVETQTAMRKHPADLGAWDCLLRGLWHVNQFRKPANAEARREFEAAIARDPGFAVAHGWLAMSHVFDAWFNWTDAHAISLDLALRAAADAARLDDAEPMSQVASAFAFFWSARMEQAHQANQRALSLNPNSFLANYGCGAALNYLGRCEEAVPYSLKALDLSPHDPLAWNCLGSLAHTYFNLGRYDEAAATADRAIVLRHGYLFGRVVKVAALVGAGRTGEARVAFRAILDIVPDFSAARLDHYPFVIDAQRQHLLSNLKEAGLSTSPVASAAAPASAAPLALPDKPSIAVLPFQNMSGDPEQEYFADGMVEDIITALSRFKSLFVIARNSSFTYKGKAVDIKQVARELGVRYVLEGSVRKAGGRVRITGQLIEAENGAHLWADRFDGSLEDVFALQDQVTTSVVGAIAPQLDKAEMARAARKPVENLDAYDYFLRGLAHSHVLTRESSDEALRLFYRAIDLDPDFATPYGLATRCYGQRVDQGWIVDREREMAEVRRLAARVAAIGRDDALALCLAGFALVRVCHDHEAGEDLIDQAIALNPNMAACWRQRAFVSLFAGEHERAIEHVGRALRLDPLDPQIAALELAMASALMLLGRHEEALDWAKRSHRHNPNAVMNLRVLAAANAFVGNLEEARRTVQRILQIDPTLTISRAKTLAPYRRPEDLSKWIEGIRLAGLPE